ncbi:MAG: SDR family NAD(P)-dependent oxidoreductase [Marmoricola sp.]
MTLPAPTPTSLALVTGASGGIGLEMARELHRRGFTVGLVARSKDKLQALADELGTRAVVLPTDLTKRATRAKLPGRIEALGFQVDILVNNAGLSTTGPVHLSDPERELGMIEVDVAAVVDFCSRFLPGMVERRRGAILNVASTASYQPVPGQAGYGAAKAFVRSYTQGLYGELRGTNVTVSALCPGPVETDFIESAGFDHDAALKSLPKPMWLSAEKVALAAIDGLDRGHLITIPGVANKVGVGLARVVPKKVLAPLLASQHPALR